MNYNEYILSDNNTIKETNNHECDSDETRHKKNENDIKENKYIHYIK